MASWALNQKHRFVEIGQSIPGILPGSHPGQFLESSLLHLALLGC
jgi:hypothetical protein